MSDTTTFNVKFENLIFTRDGSNLVITDTTDTDFEAVTYEEFFTSTEITGITALDADDNPKTYTFEDDIYINVAGGVYYSGTKYNEIITTGTSGFTYTGGAGNDVFYSNSQNGYAMFFQGDAGDDTFYTGAGGDIITGNAGSDTFVLHSGDGVNQIQDPTSDDIIKFTDVTWDELSFAVSEDNKTRLVISYGESSVVLWNYFDSDGSIKEGALDKIYTSESETPHSISEEVDFPITDFNIKFSDLKFMRVDNNLQVYNTNDTDTDTLLTTYKNFFNGSPVETINALDADNETSTYTLLTDAEIYVNMADQTDQTTYTGTDYNEIITSSDSTTSVSGGKGDDTINVNSNNGSEGIYFQAGDGDDVVNGGTLNNVLYFDDGIDYNDMSFDSDDGENLVINYGNGDSVTIVDALEEGSTLSSDTIQKFYIGDNEYSLANNSYIDNNYDAADFTNGKFTDNTGDSVKVVAQDYVSASGKGVTIKTGIGNDYIVGSMFNDSITSNGGVNTITELAGKNTIKTGAEADTIYLENYSSNTVKSGNGLNEIYVNSLGTNKITSGKDADTITVTTGNNTINAGNGLNVITLEGGINSVTTGKETDTFDISGGNNTIKSGNGDSAFTINSTSDGGNNTITTGKGTAEFVIGAGINKITTGKGDADININGGNNTINTVKSVADIDINGGLNIITSGKSADTYSFESGTSYIKDKGGNDTYNLYNSADYDDIFVSINDTKGANSVIFNEDIKDLDIFFDVKLGKKGKDGNYKYTLGKTVAFTTLDETGVYDTGFEMTLNKNKQIGDIYISEDGTTDTADKYSLSITDLAQSIANWLGASGSYKSTAEVFEKAVTDDVNSLLSLYTTVGENLNV